MFCTGRNSAFSYALPCTHCTIININFVLWAFIFREELYWNYSKWDTLRVWTKQYNLFFIIEARNKNNKILCIFRSIINKFLKIIHALSQLNIEWNRSSLIYVRCQQWSYWILNLADFLAQKSPFFASLFVCTQKLYYLAGKGEPFVLLGASRCRINGFSWPKYTFPESLPMLESFASKLISSFDVFYWLIE